MTIFSLKPLIFSSICTKLYLRFACYRSEHLNSTYINLLASLIWLVTNHVLWSIRVGSQFVWLTEITLSWSSVGKKAETVYKWHQKLVLWTRKTAKSEKQKIWDAITLCTCSMELYMAFALRFLHFRLGYRSFRYKLIPLRCR